MAWPRDPQGYHLGGSFLQLPARDLAKLGYLYLKAAVGTAPRWSRPTTWRPRPSRRATHRGPGDYGYQWWVTNETGHDSFRAMGYGSQLIQVIPELDLVVVITSDGQDRPTPPNLVGMRSLRPSPAGQCCTPAGPCACCLTCRLAGAVAPSLAGAAARRAERSARVLGTIRPHSGSRWSARRPPASSWGRPSSSASRPGMNDLDPGASGRVVFPAG